MKQFVKFRYSFNRFSIHIVLITFMLFTVCPILIMFFNSLKTTSQIRANGLTPPQAMHWENFLIAWQIGYYSKTLPNSLVITIGAALGVMLIGSLAGYSLAKLNPVSKDLINVVLLVLMVIPKILFIAPLFILWKNLRLIDSRIGVIVIYWGLWSPFATFLLRSYFMAIPNDIIHVARIDGASEWSIFSKVIIPIAWPAILTVGLIISLWAWNEFLFAVTFLPSADMKTIAISLYGFLSRWEKDWSLINAAAMMMTIPPLILFFIFQRKFIDGLTQGSIKG